MWWQAWVSPVCLPPLILPGTQLVKKAAPLEPARLTPFGSVAVTAHLIQRPASQRPTEAVLPVSVGAAVVLSLAEGVARASWARRNILLQQLTVHLPWEVLLMAHWSNRAGLRRLVWQKIRVLYRAPGQKQRRDLEFLGWVRLTGKRPTQGLATEGQRRAFHRAPLGQQENRMRSAHQRQGLWPWTVPTGRVGGCAVQIMGAACFLHQMAAAGA